MTTLMEDTVREILDKQMEEEMEIQPQAAPPESKRAFESILTDLSLNVVLSKTINKRSIELVQRVIGTSPEPAQEEKDKVEIGTSLIDRLREINRGLSEHLLKISENLDKLEGAW